MPAARATKKTDPLVRRVAAGARRSGRPRAATAASKIYKDLRVELASLQRRPGEARLTQRLLDCGFSPALIKKLATGLTDDTGDETAWATQVLERNLRAGSRRLERLMRDLPAS